MSFFIDEASARFQASFEVASLIMNTILFLYIYLVEKKIRIDQSKKEK
jgi:hypothetical protein